MVNWRQRGAIKMEDHSAANAGLRNISRRQSHMIPVPPRWNPGALNGQFNAKTDLTWKRIFRQKDPPTRKATTAWWGRIYRKSSGFCLISHKSIQTDHPLCPLTRSLPLINVDSFTPAHLAPEGLPSALSRAATLAAWVPFGPTFGCSFSKTPQPFRLCALWLVLLDSG